MDAFAIVAAFIVLLVLLVATRTVRIVPQAKARNVERLGRYRKTLEPGMNFIIPLVDRVKPLIDLREQVVSFLGQPVITEDNLVVKIDTVLFFQVTDPRAADYEIVDYIQAIEQLTATMLRSVIGSMDLEQSLTSRDQINTMLRGVLDDASGKWGIRVTRVEIKAIDPPTSVKEAMEKQMRAEREKRAAVLHAEGVRQSQILTADGDKQGTVLRAEGDKQSAILRAQGQAEAITTVFQSIHDGDPDPKLLAYQYLQTLPQLAQGSGNTVWMIPSELTSALKALSGAFGPGDSGSAPAVPSGPFGQPGMVAPAGAGGPASQPGLVAPSGVGGPSGQPGIAGEPASPGQQASAELAPARGADSAQPSATVPSASSASAAAAAEAPPASLNSATPGVRVAASPVPAARDGADPVSEVPNGASGARGVSGAPELPDVASPVEAVLASADPVPEVLNGAEPVPGVAEGP
jgi:regulator of protease activity HflC (stomatin/prohibitin superfamily)